MAREAAAVWRRQATGVRLVSIASRMWLSGGPPAYTASKAALIGLTQSLARELGPDGVTVNAVAPGLVPTPMTIGSRSAEQFEDHPHAF